MYSSEVAQSLQENFEAIRAISFEKGRGVKNYRNAPRVGTGRKISRRDGMKNFGTGRDGMENFGTGRDGTKKFGTGRDGTKTFWKGRDDKIS